MTPSDIAAIRADFAIVARAPDDFAARFYARLFTLDPALRVLFPDDLSEQRRKLVQALAMVVAGLDRLDDILPAVQGLGARHGDYGVQPEHYAIVGEAILGTLEETLGGGFGAANRAAWGEAYATLADVMVAASEARVVAA
ncbi:globin domain-containing protein [Xanthobacter sp. V4C-4]|uniref:globin domain-containing protein n=1 Tax=Xanthobacter cornucopiae TaxID=3119924 RepID=UPI0037272CB6